jgi:acetyl esterase
VKVRYETASNRRSAWLVVVVAGGLVLLGLVVRNARYGAVSPRIRNPNDTGGPHPLSNPLFG